LRSMSTVVNRPASSILLTPIMSISSSSLCMNLNRHHGRGSVVSERTCSRLVSPPLARKHHSSSTTTAVPLHTSSHYGKQGLCRAPRAHGKGLKTHGKPFTVRFLSGRTAKGAR
jgi:hypothetical protein